MKIAVITEPGRLELQTRHTPVPADDQVLVRISVCGVCGSDVGVWRGKVPKRFPYSPGHEFCGRVEKLGSRVTSFKVGQLVVIDPNLGCGECRYCRTGKPNLCDNLKSRSIKSNGGFAEYVALDARMIHVTDLPEELAIYAEPFSCALHGARAVRPGRIAVFGAGLMGILTVLALKDCEIIEPHPVRREQARRLLGVPAWSPEEVTGEFDAAIDCSGNGKAVAQAIRVLRKAGKLVLAGLVGEAALPLLEVTTKELELQGVWLNPGTFAEALALVNKHRQVLAQLKTETFALDDVAAAFERATQPDVNKILVKG